MMYIIHRNKRPSIGILVSEFSVVITYSLPIIPKHAPIGLPGFIQSHKKSEVILATETKKSYHSVRMRLQNDFNILKLIVIFYKYIPL